MGRSAKYQPGDKYGRLTLISHAGYKTSGSTLWKWKCDCGRMIVVGVHKNQKSCGCLRNENRTKHGMHNSITYQSWESMHPVLFGKLILEYRSFRFNYGGNRASPHPSPL